MKTFLVLLLAAFCFAMGCVFSCMWIIVTPNGKAWAEEHRNDPILPWFPNLPK